jgi:hypothetical protein
MANTYVLLLEEPNKGAVKLALVVHIAHLIIGCSSTGQTIAEKHVCMQQRVEQEEAGAQLRRHYGPPPGIANPMVDGIVIPHPCFHAINR